MPDLHTWGCKSQLSVNSVRGSQPLVCSLVLKPRSQGPVGCWFLHPLGNSNNSQMSRLTHAESQPQAVSVDPGSTLSPSNCPSNWREQESYNTHSLPAGGGAPGHISALVTLKITRSTDSHVGERQKKRRNMRFEDAKAKMLARF